MWDFLFDSLGKDVWQRSTVPLLLQGKTWMNLLCGSSSHFGGICCHTKLPDSIAFYLSPQHYSQCGTMRTVKETHCQILRRLSDEATLGIGGAVPIRGAVGVVPCSFHLSHDKFDEADHVVELTSDDTAKTRRLNSGKRHLSFTNRQEYNTESLEVFRCPPTSHS